MYSLEEVIAEKLRAILQQAGMSERCGWSRSSAREYYDLWQVLDTYRELPDARLRWRHVGPVAWPAGARSSSLQDGDQQSPTAGGSPRVSR